jgi:UDP-N-acetylglucosamine--N-acetylmuramyl-(pentapeptide) pyrophosphoryl-undecaprenol N-acetylglucosamine transferase
VPAIAVADALRSEGARVSFLGTRERAESELVPAAGYEIDFLPVRGLDRRNPLKAAAAALRALGAVPVARRALRRRGADVVLGGGGYVAGPAGLAAVTMGSPLVLTEADSHLGLANRLLAGRARRVCLAFPIAGRKGDRYLVTGRPVPAAILSADRDAARRRFGIAAEAQCLLVAGGSQGAHSINEAAFEAFSRDAGRGRAYHVVHVTGSRDYASLRERFQAAGAPQRYTLLAYEPDLGDALSAADLVLGRAGGSVFEIAAAGRPAILVPYPHATADHQAGNARWMVDAGAAIAVDDADLRPELVAQLVGELLGDRDRLAQMSKASRRLGRPEAASTIAGEILAATPSHSPGRGEGDGA